MEKYKFKKLKISNKIYLDSPLKQKMHHKVDKKHIIHKKLKINQLLTYFISKEKYLMLLK